MGNYSELKDLINNPTSHGLPAWDNGDNKIEGEMMKSYLLSIVNSLSAGGYLFKGVAKLTPTQTDPGTPDQNVFYIATEPGTYTNFVGAGGSLVVAEGEVAIFKYNGTWSKEVTGAATAAQVTELGQEVKLQIGGYELYQGYTKTSGGISSNPNRITTGVLKNNYGKLYVRCNQNLNILYLYGDSPNSLTDGGYISYNGVPAIVESAKYVAFNIASQVAITPSSDVGFILLSYNSSARDIDEDTITVRNITDIIDCSEGGKQAIFPFVQGSRNANGGHHNTQTKIISSRVFRVDGKYKVSCNSAYKFRLYYKADGDSTYSYIAYGVTEHVFEGRGYCYIMIQNQDGSVDISVNANTGITIQAYNIENVFNSPYKWTLVGNGTNNQLRYNSHYILRKGVDYDISFSSNKFTIAAGATTAFSIYAMAVDSNAVSAPRTNLFNPSTLPSTTYRKRFDYDVILFGVCNLAEGSYVDVNIVPELSVQQVVTINAEKIFETKLFRKYVVSDMMTKGNVVSDIIYKSAITDGFDVKKETGDLCVGYCGTTSYSEVGALPWNAELSICNLADIEGTKQRVKVLDVGQTYNGIFVGQNQHVFAAWTGDDEITLVSQIGGGNDGVVARRYKPSTQEFIGDVVYCDVDVLGTVYSMRKGTDYVEKFNAIWNATGMEHPLGRNGAEYNFFIAGCPVKIGNYFYASWVCGNYAHPLFKSQDLIHWIYVCDIPHSDDFVYDPVTEESTGTWSPSEEVSICYYRNRIYAVTRGNSMPKSQAPEGYPVPETGSNVNCWNTMLYCDFDKLEDRTPSDWSTPIVFENYSRERCTICGVSGKLFVLMGTQPFAGLPIDGATIGRGRHALMIFDTNLNLIRGTILETDTTYLHPIFIDYGGIILSVLSSDLRQFGSLFSGDNRAEIMITRLDPELLYMISERPEIQNP